jgi:putative FmdB family regulatory protein
MPIYEYWCSGCRKKVEIFFLRLRESQQPACPHCKGLELRRLVSRFSSPKSEEARLEALADPSRLAGLDENDPASMARWVKRMGRELGEDIGGEEIDQMAEEIATGEGPGNDVGEPAHDVSGDPGSGDM